SRFWYSEKAAIDSAINGRQSVKAALDEAQAKIETHCVCPKNKPYPILTTDTHSVPLQLIH
ncbi:hypothetical protein KZ316_06045, partial [Glaesserella parasuis]|nr:hypothetical protein [Glaesserella parasuis]